MVPILPRHICEPVADLMKFPGPGATVGSGPFRLASYREGTGEQVVHGDVIVGNACVVPPESP